MGKLLSGAATGEGGTMAVLACSCARGGDIWAEFWWIDQGYRWVFFDDDEASETYAEQVTHCPGCARPLERKNMRTVSPLLR
jgi:hypothetical protein